MLDFFPYVIDQVDILQRKVKNTQKHKSTKTGKNGLQGYRGKALCV